MKGHSFRSNPEALLTHAGWVRGLARSLVLDPHQAADVEQQTWLTALESPPRHAGNLTAWLGRIVRNAALELRRRESRRAHWEQQAPSGEDFASADELVEQAEMQREVVSAVLDLEEPYRSTILLRYWSALSPQQIAREDGVPAATVRSRLHRARERLREELDRRFHGDRRAWSTVLLAWIRTWEPAKGAGISAAVAGVVAMGWKLGLGLVFVAGVLLAWWGWSGSPDALEAPTTAADRPLEVASPTDRDAPSWKEATFEEPAHDTGAERAEVITETAFPGIYGTVTDLRGDPIESALVKLYREGLNWRDGDPVSVSSSDAEGHYRVRTPDGDSGRFALLGEAPGYYSASIEGLRPDREEVDLRLGWLVDLVGRVRDAETGTPIPDTRVLWHIDRETRTDVNGDFRAPQVRAGIPLWFFVRKAGYAEASTVIELNDPEDGTFDFELRRGVPLVVEVFDRETGEPIANAELLTDRYVAPLAVTDDRGRCEILVADGIELRLEVEAEGYVPFCWNHRFEEIDDALAPRIPLVPAGAIEGVITNEQGLPVAGAYVRGRCDAHPFGRWELTAEEREELDLPGRAEHQQPWGWGARTDEAGRFTLPVVPGPAPQQAVASIPKGPSATSEPVVVESSTSRPRVEIVLASGATLRGRVLYNGKPLEGGGVRWKHVDGERSGFAWTEPGGSYELTDVAAGEIALSVRAPGSRAFGELPEVTLAVDAGKTYEQDLVWEQELETISGRVTSTDGEPLSDVRLRALSFSEDGQIALFDVATEPDGTYVLEVLPSDTYEVTASYEPDSKSRADVPAGARNVDFVFAENGRLRVQLVNATTGEPVQVSDRPRNPSWRRSGDEVFQRVDAEWSLHGVAELELPVGAVDLSLFLNELGYVPIVAYGLPVTKDPTPEPIVIELTRGIEVKLALLPEAESPVDSLSNHLFFLLEDSQLALLRGPFPRQGGPSNYKINGICMWVGDPGILEQMFHPDERGRARVSGLGARGYTLRAFPDDFLFTPGTFEVTEEQADPIEIRWRLR